MSASSRPFREITLTRVFDAPRELVWRAWTDPKHLAKWFGPQGFTIPKCSIDLRIGGELHITMQSPWNSAHPMKGVFREIVKPERIVFTNIALDEAGHHLLEGITRVTFEDAGGGKTMLTLYSNATGMVPESEQMLAGMETGWSMSLDKLGELMKQEARA
jgi:uncharacterized protein YndB with AHSA1/START domain